MSLVSIVVPRCPRAGGGRRQCGGTRPREEGNPRTMWWGARLDGGSRARVRPIRSRPAGVAALERPRGNRIPSGEPSRLLGGRTALGEPVDARPGVGIRAQPDRALHGTRRARAVLLRLRTVVRGRRDCGAGGEASTRRAIHRPARRHPARHDDALRRTPEQTGSSEVGRRRGWRRPGPPDVHEPRRARRGAHLSRGFSST